MTHASLCTGIGACELAATWMGWKNAFSCEVDEFCNRILKYHYPNAIHYGNILEQDFREWRGRIDVLTAGFPCQPFSIAGKRNGADDDRYLWPEVLRAIEEIRPTWFTGENVSGITSVVFPGSEITVGRYTDTTGESYKATEMRQQFVIDRICNDLESVGYQVQPVIIPACAVGAPHRRDRVWFIAHRDGTGLQEARSEQQATGIAGSGLQRATPDPDGKRCHDGSDNREKRRVRANGKRGVTEDKPERDEQECRVSKNGTTATDPDGKRREELDAPGIANWQEQPGRNRIEIPGWQDFPTQSPVCNGNDGFPGELPGITFSRWRQASIKALGNSMVPQVVLEIFRAIEQVEKTFNK